MKEQRIVSLFDLHIPCNIPLDPIFEFIQDFKPTTVVLGGDIGQFDAVSEWLPQQSRHLDAGIVGDQYRMMNDTLWKPLKKVISSNCEVKYLEGNHEYWVQIATVQQPNLRGYVEVERNIPNWVDFIPMNVPFRVGPNLTFVHGQMAHSVTIYHAKRMVQAYHNSIIYGHHHTFQSHVEVSPIDVKKFYKAQAVGCLCDLNPSFMRNRPNAFVHGLDYVYMDTDGTFADIPTIIVKNSFWANGRKYK